MATKLADLASTFRSKNAEPFMTTVDIYFPEEDAYRRVKDSGVITEEVVQERYRLPPEAVHGIYFVDDIRAIKVSFLKHGDEGYLGQGDPDLSDMFGAQMHVPLLDVEVP
ncbi:MAG: DUF4387 domain-containing protein [Thermoleophilaceae bacterium]